MMTEMVLGSGLMVLKNATEEMNWREARGNMPNMYL